jgi:hypothetical protein
VSNPRLTRLGKPTAQPVDSPGALEKFNTGEALCLPLGFEGPFEVLEPLTKSDMVCQ